MTVVNMHPQRWHEDRHLVEAAIAGRVRAENLDAADRAWLVAELTHSGSTADMIADRLHCSRRLVLQIRAEPMTVVVTRLLECEATVAKATARAKTATAKVSVQQLVEEIGHLKQARDTLIGQLAELRKRYDAGCPQVVVMHPPRRRRPRLPDQTLPLF